MIFYYKFQIEFQLQREVGNPSFLLVSALQANCCIKKGVCCPTVVFGKKKIAQKAAHLILMSDVSGGECDHYKKHFLWSILTS